MAAVDVDLKAVWERLYSQLELESVGKIESIFDKTSEGTAAFLRLLPAGSSVLDFGCAFGRNPVPLAWWVLGVVSDISDKAVALCEQNALRQGFEIEKCLAETGKVLRPGAFCGHTGLELCWSHIL